MAKFLIGVMVIITCWIAGKIWISNGGVMPTLQDKDEKLTNIQIGAESWAPTSDCWGSKSHRVGTRFIAQKNGHIVRGTVCCESSFKWYGTCQIRY